MTFWRTVKQRQSYRGGFTDEPVRREDLIRILEAGLMAPSGKNAQTTEFVVVDAPDLVARIRACPGANRAMQQAAAYIACLVDRDPPAVFEGLNFQVEDCAAAVENMLLAITDLGYASVWVDGWLRRQGRADTLGQWLGVPPEKVIRVILPIGKAAETYPRAPKKPFRERVSFNRYGRRHS